MDEFSLIEKYFKPLGEVSLGNQSASPNVVMGIGDDCALLNSKPGHELAVSLDTLVAGVHFLENVNPVDLGYKALAVNLSDLAAMGAEPAWFTLGLSLPEKDERWLQDFVHGLSLLARQYQMPLVGGDTTKGPLTISVQVAGWVPQGQAIKRSAAQVGDDIYVTGELGWPKLGLDALQGKSDLSDADFNQAQQHLLRPEPQLVFAQQGRQYLAAGIDISDGLFADLGHILKASQVGARLNIASIPIAQPLKSLAPEQRFEALSFGDEYQLLFTATTHNKNAIKAIAHRCGVQIAKIGEITAANTLVDENGQVITAQGYKHF